MFGSLPCYIRLACKTLIVNLLLSTTVTTSVTAEHTSRLGPDTPQATMRITHIWWRIFAGGFGFPSR